MLVTILIIKMLTTMYKMLTIIIKSKMIVQF